MIIEGIEYKKLDTIEEEFGLSTGTIQRLCKKYGMKYKSLGSVKLLTDTDLLKLMDEESKNKEKRKKEQSVRMKKLVSEGKVGRKKIIK